MIERIIAAIEEERASISIRTLRHPPADYGAFRQAAGQYQALENILNIIESLMKDADEQQRNL